MNEMVERAAKAIARSIWPEQDWRVYEKTARSVIAAMREPTEEMCAAPAIAEYAWVNDEAVRPAEIKQAWREMIDEALK